MALVLKTPNLRLKTGMNSSLREETPSEEKNESIHTEVAEFIDCLLTGAAIVHKMHLRETGQGSFAAHLALNDLYDKLPEHADDLAEKYQGKMGVLLPDVSVVDQLEYLKMGHLEYVEYLINYVETDRVVFGDCSPLQNLVDELLATLYTARYKLKFLS